MRKKIRALLSVLVALALTVCMLAWLTDLTERKDSDFKYAPFFDQRADFDVLFFGSSHMINGVFPMELWKDYGIVSYNFGGHLNYIPVSYWVMKNALRYTSPKLAVVDCALLRQEMKMDPNFSYCHLSFDAFPLSLTKLRAGLDLLDDSVMDQQAADGAIEVSKSRSLMGFLWDFSEYHSRWDSLGRSDFFPQHTLEKGAESRVNVAEPRASQPTDAVQEPTTGTEYLRRFIEDCRQQGVQVLLVYLPFPASETYWQEANTARAVAEECGADFINYLDMDVADFSTDCYDSWSHLNPSGARKVTDHLGQYIREHYDVPDRRDDPAYAGWNDDYEAYTDYKLELLEQQTELKNYLVLLQDRHLSACLYLAQSELWTGRYRALLENMGADPDVLSADGPALVLADRLDGTVSVLRPGQQAASGFGTVSLVPAEDGTYTVRVGERDALTLPADAAAGAVVMSGLDGRLAAPARFSSGPAGEIKIPE